jgi:hypothetical protein
MSGAEEAATGGGGVVWKRTEGRAEEIVSK